MFLPVTLFFTLCWIVIFYIVKFCTNTPQQSQIIIFNVRRRIFIGRLAFVWIQTLEPGAKLCVRGVHAFLILLSRSISFLQLPTRTVVPLDKAPHRPRATGFFQNPDGNEYHMAGKGKGEQAPSSPLSRDIVDVGYSDHGGSHSSVSTPPRSLCRCLSNCHRYKHSFSP
jgi:hypothetical protein